MIHLSVPMIPPSPNERKYEHHFAYKRLRETWENALFYSVAARQRAELVDFAVGHRMRARFVIHHSRQYDPDNAAASLKPVIDALRNVGFIKNDTKQWLDLVLPVEQIKSTRKDAHTEIWIGPTFPE